MGVVGDGVFFAMLQIGNFSDFVKERDTLSRKKCETVHKWAD